MTKGLFSKLWAKLRELNQGWCSTQGLAATGAITSPQPEEWGAVIRTLTQRTRWRGLPRRVCAHSQGDSVNLRLFSNGGSWQKKCPQIILVSLAGSCGVRELSMPQCTPVAKSGPWVRVEKGKYTFRGANGIVQPSEY